MDAHNLSVCVAPNLFQTKQNCKVIQQQNAAVEICIKNVLNIGEWLLSAWSTLNIYHRQSTLFEFGLWTVAQSATTDWLYKTAS